MGVKEREGCLNRAPSERKYVFFIATGQRDVWFVIKRLRQIGMTEQTRLLCSDMTSSATAGDGEKGREKEGNMKKGEKIAGEEEESGNRERGQRTGEGEIEGVI